MGEQRIRDHFAAAAVTTRFPVRPGWRSKYLLRNHGEIILADQVAGVVQQRRRA